MITIYDYDLRLLEQNREVLPNFAKVMKHSLTLTHFRPMLPFYTP